MILINGSWEKTGSLQDIAKVVREHYNSELADEMEALIPEHTKDEYYDLEFELDQRNEKISELEDNIDWLEGRIGQLEDQIAELKEK